jgi:toxin YhaV
LHPAFSQGREALIRTVEALAKRQPLTFRDHPKAKLLRRIQDLVLVEIPRDPNASEFQLGNTLGTACRHWRRAKFLGRFRLFFRFSSAHKIIVYAWVNDETTLRKAGAGSDPYAVFNRRLQTGCPPDDWDRLLREAEAANPPLDPDRKRKADKPEGRRRT